MTSCLLSPKTKPFRNGVYSLRIRDFVPEVVVVVVAMLFYVHGKHLRSCRDGQLT